MWFRGGYARYEPSGGFVLWLNLWMTPLGGFGSVPFDIAQDTDNERSAEFGCSHLQVWRGGVGIPFCLTLRDNLDNAQGERSTPSEHIHTSEGFFLNENEISYS